MEEFCKNFEINYTDTDTNSLIQSIQSKSYYKPSERVCNYEKVKVNNYFGVGNLETDDENELCDLSSNYFISLIKNNQLEIIDKLLKKHTCDMFEMKGYKNPKSMHFCEKDKKYNCFFECIINYDDKDTEFCHFVNSLPDNTQYHLFKIIYSHNIGIRKEDLEYPCRIEANKGHFVLFELKELYYDMSLEHSLYFTLQLESLKNCKDYKTELTKIYTELDNAYLVKNEDIKTKLNLLKKLIDSC